MTLIKLIIIFCCLFALVACSTTIPAAKSNPAASAINVKLGLAYMQQGEIEFAKAKLLTALQQDANNFLAYDAMGYFLENAGNAAAAEAYYLQGMKKAAKEERGAAWNNYGAYLYRQGRYQLARQYFIMAAKDLYYLHAAKAYENAARAAAKL